jgi:hypothetical protein
MLAARVAAQQTASRGPKLAVDVASRVDSISELSMPVEGTQTFVQTAHDGSAEPRRRDGGR